MESQSLIYTGLPQGRFFRLLKIHPGSFNDELACDLFVCELNTAPAYTALSYVWGDPIKAAKIICSGHTAKITQGLSDGLRSIREVNTVQVAWADAICINQDDMIEKGHQVDLMGLIYDRAWVVLVWLGPDQMDFAQDAFNAIQIVNEKIFTKTDKEWHIPEETELPWRNITIQSSSSEEPTKLFGTTYARRSTLSSVLRDRERDCVRKLFGLAWFSRVWVLQEVGLATIAMAYWGNSSIAFSEIAEFILNSYFNQNLKDALGPEITAALAGSPLYGLWNVWATYEKKDSWIYRTPVLRGFTEQLAEHHDIDFTLVLEASRYFNATNKLDHIYAFLGHPKAKTPGTGKTWIQANYSLSLQEQHRLLASAMAQDSLNFLVQSQQTEESMNHSAYPTWVPRWNERDSMHAEAFWEMWDASLRKAEAQPFPAVSSGSKLSVAGLVIDAIDQFTPTMQKSDFEPIHKSGGRLIDQCHEMTKHKQCPYPPEETVQAFASTLVCQWGKTRNSQQNHDPSLAEQFAGLCSRINVESFKDLKPGDDSIWALDTSVIDGERFGEVFKTYATNRRFFITRTNGFWGLGPAAMQQSDVCVVLFGADVPFVLRPIGSRNEYKVVGQCYMYKFMDGEVILSRRSRHGSFTEKDFILV